MPRHYKVIVSAEAQRNIEEILLWISNSAPQAAERWYDGLIAALRNLSSFPSRCPISPETELCLIDHEIRQLLYGTGFWKYRILFSIEGDTVLIAHVRHSARLYIGQEALREEDDS